VKHFQGHNVKHSNRNNSAADCSILLKVGGEFHRVTCDTSQMFKVKGQCQGQRSSSQRNITYQ